MATDTKTYNGYKNYETWCVNLWLSNEEPTCRACREIAAQCRKDAPDHANAKPTAQRYGSATKPMWTIDEAARFTTADALKAFVEENCLPDLGATMASDMLSAAMEEVDWVEVADAFLEP